MVRGEIHEWEVNRENIFSVEEIIIRDLSYEGRESKLFKSTNCETYTIIAEEEKIVLRKLLKLSHRGFMLRLNE